MRFLFYLAIIAAGVCIGCKKGNQPVLTEGTVVQVTGTQAFVKIHNPDPARYSFICNDPTTVSSPDPNGVTCANSVFILNLPQHLIVEGKQIRFTRFTDKGPRPIWSYAFAAHDILVYDAEEL